MLRNGGGKGIRTPGLLIANETLYQLSYTPKVLVLRIFIALIYLQFQLLKETECIVRYIEE